MQNVRAAAVELRFPLPCEDASKIAAPLTPAERVSSSREPARETGAELLFEVMATVFHRTDLMVTTNLFHLIQRGRHRPRSAGIP